MYLFGALGRSELLKAGQIVPFQELQAKEAVMDDGRKEEAGTPQPPRYVTERQLHRVLDETMWQVERRRVDPVEPPKKSA